MTQEKSIVRIIAKRLDNEGVFIDTQEFTMTINRETLLYSAEEDIRDTCKEMIKRHTEGLNGALTEAGLGAEHLVTYEYYSHAPVFLEPILLGDAEETFQERKCLIVEEKG